MGIILLVLLLSAWEAADATKPYDVYFQFVQQWPAEKCFRDRVLRHGSPVCFQPVPKFFTVHGLWPTKNSWTARTPPPACVGTARTPPPASACVGTPFDEDEMSKNRDLMKDLRKAWPQLEARTTMEKAHAANMHFWKDEYNKHGTCSENKLDQTQYFREAYWMWSLYRADLLFEKSSQKISPGSHYTLADLENAIWEGTGGRPLLRCRSRKRKVGAKHENDCSLEEVIICFDLGKKVINCVRQTNCSGNIYYRCY